MKNVRGPDGKFQAARARGICRSHLRFWTSELLEKKMKILYLTLFEEKSLRDTS